MNDHFDLQRFVEAQAQVYGEVLKELERGIKISHWMWFVFPQIRGLGQSDTDHRFSIQSLEEATAYLAHAILGPRLRECTQLVVTVQGRSAERIFGDPDYLKFRSSMTLFTLATADNQISQRFQSERAGSPRVVSALAA